MKDGMYALTHTDRTHRSSLKTHRLWDFVIAEASLNVSKFPISYRERESECVLSGLGSWPFHSEWMGIRVEDLNKQTVWLQSAVFTLLKQAAQLKLPVLNFLRVKLLTEE